MIPFVFYREKPGEKNDQNSSGNKSKVVHSNYLRYKTKGKGQKFKSQKSKWYLNFNTS